MGIQKSRLALLTIVGVVIALLAVSAWGTGATLSQAADGDQLENCPQPGKWAISVWNGADATATDQALATCEGVTVDVAYWLNPDSQQWLRYFPSKPEVSNLLTLDSMQAIIARGAPDSGPAAGQPGALFAAGATAADPEPQNQIVNCPQAGKWATSVWSGDDGRPTEEALATCSDPGVAAVYWLNPDTQGWLRYFSGRPELATLTALNNVQGFIALGSTSTATPTPAATATPTPAATGIPTPTPTPSPGITLTPGATFSGTTSQGKEITFEICDSAACISKVVARASVQCTPGGAESWRRSIYNEIPIVDKAFTLELAETTFSGQFTSPTAATGNVQIYSKEYREGEGWVICDSGQLTWSAATN